MRLIDADALCRYANNTKDKTVDANDIMRFPTVDAVQVVRCGECRYWESAKDPDDGGRCIADGFQLTDREWYCADGERREE